MRAIWKTLGLMKMVTETFLLLRTGIEKVLDPLAMFSNMLRMSLEQNKRPSSKQSKTTSPKANTKTKPKVSRKAKSSTKTKFVSKTTKKKS